IAAFSAKTVEQAKARLAELTKTGASQVVVDVRRTSGGNLDAGIGLARLFVAKGTLAIRETRNRQRETIEAAEGAGSPRMAVIVLIDAGTSGAAEVFAAALAGNDRAELVGERTIGRAASQKLIKLPDGSGLSLSTTKYLTPAGNPLHEKGLEPTVAVDEPDVEFGQSAPATDPVLEKAIERATQKKAA